MEICIICMLGSGWHFFFLQRRFDTIPDNGLSLRGFTITIIVHTTHGRTPLYEWSARRRDLYLTNHTTHVPPNGFEPLIPANERPHTHALRLLESAVDRLGVFYKKVGSVILQMFLVFVLQFSNYLNVKHQQTQLCLLRHRTQVRGFKPGRSRRIFQDEKILSTPSFGREVKLFLPCRRYTACKRSLNVTWKSGIFRQNSLAISRPSSSSFHY